MMKKWLLSTAIVGIMLLYGTHAYAEDDIRDHLEPNIYEEIDINIKQDSKDNPENKEKLSEEQQRLTFERPKAPEQMLDKLFLTSKIEKNTTKTKAIQLELFSKLDEQVKQHVPEEEPTNSSSRVIFILAIAVVIVLGAFIFIVPKLQSHEQPKKG